jgi:putative oxidoreductase
MGGGLRSSGVLISGPDATPLKRMTWRRSFSAFPDGWPGHGLLLLRLTLGLPLVCWGIADVAVLHLTAVPDLAAAVAGIFLISGLFTSVAGAIIVLMQALLAFSPAFASDGERSIHLFLAAISASVAMLGPGAWSVDARRFGRKVFEIGEPRHPRS